MPYFFVVETYASERIKVLSVWSEFRDEDMRVRTHPTDTRILEFQGVQENDNGKEAPQNT